MLRVEDLTVSGLAPISFEVGAGTCLVIQGPSGSGKTLIMRAMADLDPVNGYIYVQGREREEMSGPDWRSLVRYGAAEPGWWAPVPRAHFEADAQVDRVVVALGLPNTALDRPLTELSTGERQRLALIRTLSGNPKVLLLDEPTAALDKTSADLAEELIKFQLRSGKAVVLVTHDESQALRLADQWLILRNGSGKVFRR
ncbi:MAG: ATP-binding cassette domain-containing protein [Hyphomicrobiaceae bacterium]